MCKWVPRRVIDDLVSSDDPQEKLKRFTHALHEVFAFGSSKKHEPAPIGTPRTHSFLAVSSV